VVKFNAIEKTLIERAKITDMKKRIEKAHNVVVFNQKASYEIPREDRGC